MKNNWLNKVAPFTWMLIFVLLNTSCIGPYQPTSKENIIVKSLQFPAANYYALMIIDGNLTSLVSHTEVKKPYQFAQEGENNLYNIDFGQDQRCTLITDYDTFGVFPDGRLQVWEFCRMWDENLANRTLVYLMAYDWPTGDLEEIAGPLPLGSSGSSWNPKGTRAIAYLDSGFASRTLYWIWKGGFEPLDLVVGNQVNSWNLKDDFPDFKGAETGKTGNIGRAAWSSDGESIAFFASPDAVGKTGSKRFNVEYSLYLMNANLLEPYSVLDNIHSPFVLDWSPDSKYVAFVGEYGYSRKKGVWLYSLESDLIINIDIGKFQDVLWSAGTTDLYAIKCDDNYDCTQILEYDLSEIINQ